MSKPVYCTLIQALELQERGLIEYGDRPTLSFKDGAYYWVLDFRLITQCTADDAVDALLDHALMLESLLAEKHNEDVWFDCFGVKVVT